MKNASILCVLLAMHPVFSMADQMDERVARAAAIQEAEDNNKLCQLGSPECRGVPGRIATLGAPGLPPVPNGSQQLTPYAPSGVAPSEAGAVAAAPVMRPKAVGLTVIGAQRLLEVRYGDELVTLREGDTLGGWNLVSLSDKGAAWTKEKQDARVIAAGKTAVKPVGNPFVKKHVRPVAKPKLVYDVFGAPALGNPVVIR